MGRVSSRVCLGAYMYVCTCSRNSHYTDQIGGFPGDFCTFLAMPQIGNKMLIYVMRISRDTGGRPLIPISTSKETELFQQ